MEHAIQILEERRWELKKILRQFREWSDTIGCCAADAAAYQVMLGHVEEALRLLRGP